MFLQKYQLPTGRHSFHDITATVRRAISESGVQEGVAVIFTPHTTAGITINENADPDVLHDLEYGLDHTFPNLPQYRHAEENSDAHMKSSLVSASLSVIITGGKPILGVWQDIYFCEFDGTRHRTYYIKVLEG